MDFDYEQKGIGNGLTLHANVERHHDISFKVRSARRRDPRVDYDPSALLEGPLLAPRLVFKSVTASHARVRPRHSVKVVVDVEHGVGDVSQALVQAGLPLRLRAVGCDRAG